jgi:hypothetical protein
MWLHAEQHMERSRNRRINWTAASSRRSVAPIAWVYPLFHPIISIRSHPPPPHTTTPPLPPPSPPIRGYPPPHGYTHSTNSTVLLLYAGKVMRPFRISAAMRCLYKDTFFNVHCDLMLCSSPYIQCIACAIKKMPHSSASPH